MVDVYQEQASKRLTPAVSGSVAGRAEERGLCRVSRVATETPRPALVDMPHGELGGLRCPGRHHMPAARLAPSHFPAEHFEDTGAAALARPGEAAGLDGGPGFRLGEGEGHLSLCL